MKNKVIFWLATGFIFLFEGLMSLATLIFAPEYANAGTKPLGYPDYFAYTLIIFKVLGATALVIRKLHPKIREWAYAGLTFNLVFATISYVATGDDFAHIIFPMVICAILGVSYIYNSKLNNNG